MLRHYEVVRIGLTLDCLPKCRVLLQFLLQPFFSGFDFLLAVVPYSGNKARVRDCVPAHFFNALVELTLESLWVRNGVQRLRRLALRFRFSALVLFKLSLEFLALLSFVQNCGYRDVSGRRLYRRGA